MGLLQNDFDMQTVPDKIVGLERMSDCRGISLQFSAQ